MITNRNSVRAQLNRRARQRLTDAGFVQGPELVATGRSFQVGDYVIARRNNRLLRGTHDRDFWVRNGSRGTVAAVHPAQGALDVDFDTAQGPCRVRLPAPYLTVGHLEHAYAVTDYAVQGRTLGRSRALFDDSTTTAGAYVATTRGRLENRVYVIDGTVADARDHATSHGPPPVRESSFDTLAARLEADRPDALLHQIDPQLTEASTLAARHSLAQLHAALAPVASVLSAAPADVGRRIAGAEAATERLLTRRRLLVDRLSDNGRRGASHRRPRHRPAEGIASDIKGIDTALGGLAGRLAALRAEDAARQEFLDRHRQDIARAALLREAIAMRQAHIRLGAGPLWASPAGAGAGHYTTPTRDQRAAERDAAEQAAIHRDRRHPAAPGQGISAIELLGPRPLDNAGAAADPVAPPGP
jgi:hypothetical protein